MNVKRKVYLILLIFTALIAFMLPEITGHNTILIRSFEWIPFTFFVLFILSSD